MACSSAFQLIYNELLLVIVLNFFRLNQERINSNEDQLMTSSTQGPGEEEPSPVPRPSPSPHPQNLQVAIMHLYNK